MSTLKMRAIVTAMDGHYLPVIDKKVEEQKPVHMDIDKHGNG
jgi:hypothetical protein